MRNVRILHGCRGGFIQVRPRWGRGDIMIDKLVLCAY